MAAGVASGVLKTGEGLPYVGPLCTAIQRIMDIINVSKNVRQVWMEEFPTELRMMQITLQMLPDSTGALLGDEKILCNCRLKQLCDYLHEMENIIAFLKPKGAISRALRAKADKERIDGLRTAMATAKQVDLNFLPPGMRAFQSAWQPDLILLLSIFRGTRLDTLTASMARLHGVIAPVVELLNKANMHRVTNLMKQLDQEYSDTMYEHILKLELYQERMGDRYATALILPPILVSPEEREEILGHMRTLGVFWRGIQQQYQNGTDIFDGNKHWLHRGIRYRTLAEPLDIANWYFRRKHLQYGHYIDGISECDELEDNNKRPGRYILLQQKEKELMGRTPVSSLSTARQLKDVLKNTSWVNFGQEGKL